MQEIGLGIRDNNPYEIGIIGEDVDRALCSRLVDLEDIIDYSSLV